MLSWFLDLDFLGINRAWLHKDLYGWDIQHIGELAQAVACRNESQRYWVQFPLGVTFCFYRDSVESKESIEFKANYGKAWLEAPLLWISLPDEAYEPVRVSFVRPHRFSNLQFHNKYLKIAKETFQKLIVFLITCTILYTEKFKKKFCAQQINTKSQCMFSDNLW